MAMVPAGYYINAAGLTFYTPVPIENRGFLNAVNWRNTVAELWVGGVVGGPPAPSDVIPGMPTEYQISQGAVYSPPSPEPGDAPAAITPIPGIPIVYDGGGTMLPSTTIQPGSSPPDYVTLGVTTDGGGGPSGGAPMTAADLSSLSSAITGGNIAAILSLVRAFITKYGLTLVKSVLLSLGATWVLNQLTGGGLFGDEPPQVEIVKRWSANGWPFMMDSKGVIWTKNKDGVWKHWKPVKPIVMVRGRTTLAGAVKAQRYLDHLWRTVAKRTKALKLA